MHPTARPATPDDLPVLARLYRELEVEQTALRPMWRLADGLAEPVEETLAAIVGSADPLLYVGLVDDVAVGFVWATVDDLLPQAGGLQVGTVRLIFTEPPARGVGVGEAMMAQVLGELRGRGVTMFDAKVSPGHRHAKNFFEAHGFSARLIVMHHDDER